MVFAYTTRGSIYEHLKDTTAALADYTQAIKIDPTVYKSYEHRAELYYYQHKYAQSDADYLKMTQMDDNGAVAIMRRPYNAWLWLYMFDKNLQPIASFCGHEDLDGFAKYVSALKELYRG